MDRQEFGIESKRVSTSSQTNYLDGDKILYARISNKTYVKVKENGNKQFGDSFRKFYFKDYNRSLKNQGNNCQGAMIGKYLSPGVGKNWINEVFENFPKANEKTRTLWSRVDKKQVRKKEYIRIPKQQSKSQEEALFEELPKKSQKKKIKDFSMHKTFYDIFPDIKQNR